MAAIPYLWYWIVGGLVAVLIATVAIFSERITPDLAGNKTISSEIEDSSGADLGGRLLCIYTLTAVES